jgi:hypothetical protein
VSKDEEEATVPEPPKKELKPLPDNLKYKFLGPAETLPVIISWIYMLLRRRNC